MTSLALVETRNGYTAEVTPKKFLYVRRAHPKDPPELVLGVGDHKAEIIPLTKEQHKALARDLMAMLLTTSVFA
jgi:hypothetical protein